MFESPVISRNKAQKRRLFNISEEEESTQEIKKPKMATPLTTDHLAGLINTIKESQDNNTTILTTRIDRSEERLNLKLDNMQQDVTCMKAKQDAQDKEILKLHNNNDKLLTYHTEVTKRLDALERGERVKNNLNKNNLSAFHERLREQVAKTFMKVAIYDLPAGQDTSYIRKQAATMDLPQEIKDEIRNNQIEFIPDKRAMKNRVKEGKLHHMITSGLQARQAIIHAAKNRPGNMRWDIVIPKDFKIGYNQQKSLVWQLRNGLNMSTQQEIHGHTAYVYIKEKNSTDQRQIFSEFTPAEKIQRKRLSRDDMDTNVDNPDDDKPTILYSDNKSIADELACIIFWTGLNQDEQNDVKMNKLKAIMTEEDFALINERPTHTKYQTRLKFNCKEDAIHIYTKYKPKKDQNNKWDWSIFNMDNFKIE